MASATGKNEKPYPVYAVPGKIRAAACFFFSAALIIPLIFGCKRIDPLDPMNIPRFVAEPAVAQMNAAAISMSAQVSARATLTYAVVSNGAPAPSTAVMRYGRAADSNVLSSGAFAVADGAVSFSVVVPHAAGNYDIYLSLISVGVFADVMTAAVKRSVSFTAAAYQYQAKWGAGGSGDGEFNTANGIAVDAAGNVYVADKLNQRIQKFSRTGAFIAKWGSNGTGDGQFSDPCSIAVSAAGAVYVCDWNNNRVQKFTDTGAFVAKWGGPGSGDGQFDTPNYVAVDAAGNVFVTESEWGANRVQKFTADGVFSTKWSGIGNGIAADPLGYIYVTDYSGNMVKKFTGAGGFVTQWAVAGGPDGIAVDAAGYVYVCANSANLVRKYTGAGVFVTQWGGAGAADGQFNAPSGIAVDPEGTIYVVDAGNDRVQKFR